MGRPFDSRIPDMKIVLKPLDLSVPAEGAIVGTLNGQPLLRIGREWRTPARDYTTDELGEALVEAVDEAATAVLGPEWVTNLARLSQLNRRSTSKDRIAKSGLPEYVLVWLGRAADSDFPRAIGHHLMALDIVQSAPGISIESEGMPGPDGTGTVRPTAIDVAGRNLLVSGVAADALALFDGIQEQREAFRNAKTLTDRS
jgi:hypothetical protein